MNWNRIRNKYPKAHELYDSWHMDIYRNRGRDYISYEDRDLYDFFDENHIYITLEGYLLASYIVNKEGSRLWAEDPLTISYKSRSQAESSAFEKAFEILEERLN